MTFSSWVKGWMLGKYDRYQALQEDEDFEEWLEGYKWGATEIGEFENWIYLIALAILKHPQLYFIVHKLNELGVVIVTAKFSSLKKYSVQKLYEITLKNKAN